MTTSTLPRIASLIVFGLAAASAQTSESDRLQRAMDWPAVDLTAYETLYIEDVRVTDPKAAERTAQELVQTVPERMANLILFSVDPDLWDEVERGSPETGKKGLILRVDLTQYKPGSLGARATLIGTGSAHLNLRATLVDAASGQELAAFDENRTFAWGGFIGASRGITLMELMIVVVIVGIMAAIAYPNYRDFAARAKRTEAKAILLEIAQNQERFYLNNNTFTTDMTQLGFSSSPATTSRRFSARERPRSDCRRSRATSCRPTSACTRRSGPCRPWRACWPARCCHSPQWTS